MSFQKLFIISGEASGDLHGGNLLIQLKNLHPALEVKAWGGDHLEAAGAQIEVRYETINFMGFSEVLKNLNKILKLFRIAKKSIIEFKPDALLLIDYPGFNLRIAKWAHEKGIPVYYYIAPQVWAWKEKRVKTIQDTVRKLFVILPFEKEYFQKHGINAYYYGHPLAQSIIDFPKHLTFRETYSLNDQSILAILPGSRAQEIRALLPVYLDSIKNDRNYQIVIAGLKQSKSFFPKIIYNDTYNILQHTTLAIVTSGTATLETALFGVPQIVCYKGNQLSYWLAKKLIKVKYISLVNLIADKKMVPELIQSECTPKSIQFELFKLSQDTVKSQLKSELHSLRSLLQGEEPYKNVALEISKDFH
jgi:lipid-A-disaccharide synthase